MKAATSDSSRQKVHYERIHDAYEAHYYDDESLRYREQFIFDPLLSGLDLNDLDVLDVASGSGHNTRLLQRRFPRLRAIGLDISSAACEAYSTTTGCRAICADLTAPLSLSERFDAAVAIGGLHHCIADLPQTLTNLATLLKPNGVLLMMEPSADGFLQAARNRWYGNDHYFDAETERALSHDQILAAASGDFRGESLQYIGGPAYFLILNSLVLRIPLGAKNWIAPVAFFFERALGRFNGRATAPAFIARWRRV